MSIRRGSGPVKQINQRLGDRSEVQVGRRDLAPALAVAGYPKKRTNVHQEVDRNTLAHDCEMTEIDRQINQLRAELREIDEAVLQQAEVNGKRPGPHNRHDILNRFPQARDECAAAFNSLRSAVLSTTQDPVEATRLVKQAKAPGSEMEEIARPARDLVG